MFDVDFASWKRLLTEDGEFRRAARGWNGSFAFADEDGCIAVELQFGAVIACTAAPRPGAATVTFAGPAAGWRHILSELPPPYYQDLLGGAVGRHGFAVSGDLTVMAAYYGAIMRAVRLAGAASGVPVP